MSRAFWDDGPVENYLTQVVVGVAIAVIVSILAFIAKLPQRLWARQKAEKTERAARHDEYLWRRREAFDDLLADFRPMHQRWSKLRGVLLRQQFGRVANMDEQTEEHEVEALETELKKRLSQLSDRAPSDDLRRAVASATKKHDAIERALIFNNHVLMDGNDENKEDAYLEFYEKMDDYDEGVRELSEVAYKESQPRAPRKVDPVSVIGIVVFAGIAVTLVLWAFSVEAVWARVILLLVALMSAIMLAGPISTFWKVEGEDASHADADDKDKPPQDE